MDISISLCPPAIIGHLVNQTWLDIVSRRSRTVTGPSRWKNHSIKVIGKLRCKKFQRRDIVSIPVGITNGDAKGGWGQTVFFRPHSDDTHVLVRIPTSGRPKIVSHENVIFHASMDLENVKECCRRLYAHAVALRTAEGGDIISGSEASLASRYRSARYAALRVAKTKHIYQGSDIMRFTAQEEQLYDEGLDILTDFIEEYDTDIDASIFARAASFYVMWRNHFPQGFYPDKHLDYFILWYNENTNEIFEDNTAEPQENPVIVRFKTYFYDAVLEMQNIESFINTENVETARWASPIGMEAIQPDNGITTLDENSMWNVYKENGLLTESEKKIGFVTHPETTKPQDLSNMRYSSYFLPGIAEPPSVPYNVLPRVSVCAKPENIQALILLRKIENKYLNWYNDVMAIMVLEEIRKAADDGNLAEMRRLYQGVKGMMAGLRPDEIEYDDAHDISDDEN